jgi:hypothetical protein
MPIRHLAEVPAQTRMTSAGLLESLSFVQNKFDHASPN